MQKINLSSFEIKPEKKKQKQKQQKQKKKQATQVVCITGMVNHVFQMF